MVKRTGPRASCSSDEVSSLLPSPPALSLTKTSFTVHSAGGLGVIGGLRYSPKMLRGQIRRLKEALKDPKAPFGVDLLFPQVGETVCLLRPQFGVCQIECNTIDVPIPELRLHRGADG